MQPSPARPPSIVVRFTPALPCVACSQEATLALVDFMARDNPDNPMGLVPHYVMQPMCRACIQGLAQRYDLTPDP